MMAPTPCPAETTATHARALALEALLLIERGAQTLADVMANKRFSILPQAERAFLQELLFGTLRHRGAVDHSLQVVLDHPLNRLSPPALLPILRLGAYQILRMRTPHHASVSQSVALAHRRAPRATSIVNAALRRLAREGPAPAPDPENDPIGWMTTIGSLPRWLAERWSARLGAARAVARARAMLAVPPIDFRLNPRVSDAAERVAASLKPLPQSVPGALRAEHGAALDLAQQNVIYIQSLGSQLIARVAVRPGLVLDACAAPGGKATLMGDLKQTEGCVIAADASSRRLKTMSQLIRRWGASNIRCVAADARRPPFVGGFDSILVDAPCSGLGTLARNPDIRWKSSEKDLSRHSERQNAILAGLASLVKFEGRLVYSTCSSEPEENEQVIDAFLSTHPDYRVDMPPSWAVHFSDGPYLRTLPELDGGDLFFAATLVRH